MECITSSLSITSDLQKRRISVFILCSIFKAEKEDLEDYFFLDPSYCSILSIWNIKNPEDPSFIYFSVGGVETEDDSGNPWEGLCLNSKTTRNYLQLLSGILAE